MDCGRRRCCGSTILRAHVFRAVSYDQQGIQSVSKVRTHRNQQSLEARRQIIILETRSIGNQPGCPLVELADSSSCSYRGTPWQSSRLLPQSRGVKITVIMALLIALMRDEGRSLPGHPWPRHPELPKSNLLFDVDG